MSKTVSRTSGAERWADRICSQLGKSVEAIIEVGRLLVKAKTELPHGEWKRMFDSDLVPFGIRTAQRLMVIAGHPVISNATHASYLPASWMTLYNLSKVEPKRLNAAFKDGIITPDMPRKAVAALLPPRRAKHETDSLAEPVTVLWSRELEASRISSALRPAHDLLREWPDDLALDLFIHEVGELVKRLRQLEDHRAALSA
jgi:DUF3102 family protein